jgi:RNA polymerase sigma factor (sigma-70 family)
MIKSDNFQSDETGSLISKSKDGDRASQYALYKKYSRAMYNICYRIVNEEEEARDVLQDAFIRAFQNLRSFRGESTFGAWLKKIVINQAINHLRKQKLMYEPLGEADYGESVVNTDDDNIMLNVERVKNALQQLPDGFRTVFSLYLLEGYDHAEIGQILGISESTSKTQYIRAKNKLKELLKERI